MQGSAKSVCPFEFMSHVLIAIISQSLLNREGHLWVLGGVGGEIPQLTRLHSPTEFPLSDMELGFVLPMIVLPSSLNYTKPLAAGFLYLSNLFLFLYYFVVR